MTPPRPENCPTPNESCPADNIPDHASLVVTPKHITEAVQAGLIAALSDERTWAAASAGIKASARREAGTVLINALGNVFRKITLFVVAGLTVYWIGGWSALVAVWSAVFGHKP